MKKFTSSLMLFVMAVGLLHAQYLVSIQELGVASESTVIWELGKDGRYESTMEINGVKIFKVTYNTIDVFGNPTIASGAMYVPQLDVDTFPLVSWQHGVVMHRNRVPSRRENDLMGYFYAGNGYITTLPDYLGMGDNPGIHPVVHWESEATASIDLIRAAREFLNDSLEIGDNNQIFLTGYSMGGHSTMAMHKYIQTRNLGEEFNIVASAPCSGPYFPSNNFIWNEDSTYYFPMVLPYIIASFNYVYGNLFSEYSQYYDPPYDSLIAYWDSIGIYSKDYPWEAFPWNYYDFMQDSVVDNMINKPNHPFNVAFRKNDVHNWAPGQPVRMLYCGMDSMVSPQNALQALDTMIALGASDVLAIDIDAQIAHETCQTPSDMYVLKWFDSLAVKQTLNLSDHYLGTGISLYPNPAKNQLTIELRHTGQSSIEITTVNGQILYSTKTEEPTLQLDLSCFQKGIYFITVRSRDYVWTEKIIKL